MSLKYGKSSADAENIFMSTLMTKYFFHFFIFVSCKFSNGDLFREQFRQKLLSGAFSRDQKR